MAKCSSKGRISTGIGDEGRYLGGLDLVVKSTSHDVFVDLDTSCSPRTKLADYLVFVLHRQFTFLARSGPASDLGVCERHSDELCQSRETCRAYVVVRGVGRMKYWRKNGNVTISAAPDSIWYRNGLRSP